MAAIIAKTDLPTALQSAELVGVMVAAANAKASRVAPCLTWDGTVADQPAPSEDQLAEAKLILIGMVKRWHETGASVTQYQVSGPFATTTDTTHRTGYNPWPSEIEALEDLCREVTASAGAFSITPTPVSSIHAPWCDLHFGGATCSCGANLAGYPMYEPE